MARELHGRAVVVERLALHGQQRRAAGLAEQLAPRRRSRCGRRRSGSPSAGGRRSAAAGRRDPTRRERLGLEGRRRPRAASSSSGRWAAPARARSRSTRTTGSPSSSAQSPGDVRVGPHGLEAEHGGGRLLTGVREVVVEAGQLQGPAHLGLHDAGADAAPADDQPLVDELLHGPPHRRPGDRPAAAARTISLSSSVPWGRVPTRSTARGAGRPGTTAGSGSTGRRRAPSMTSHRGTRSSRSGHGRHYRHMI